MAEPGISRGPSGVSEDMLKTPWARGAAGAAISLALFIPAAATPVSAVGGLSVIGGPQGTASATVDIDKLGPQVGDRMPDFMLPDQHNEQHSLKSLLGSKGAVIVFFRSADW